MKKLSLTVKSIFYVGVLISLSLPLTAGAPGEISYQGKLADSAGNPINGDRSVSVRICTDEEGADCPYSESQGSISFNNGLFSLIIGQSTVIPVSVFNGNDRWLEITVGGNVFTPRQKLVSVPFALSVADGAITDNSISAGLLSASKIDFSSDITMATDKNLVIQGTGKVTLPVDPLLPNDAANKHYVDFATDSVRTNNVWQESGTSLVLKTLTNNVGIGTLTPDSSMNLDVNGTARFGKNFKSTFTVNGDLEMAPGAGISLSGGVISGMIDPSYDHDAANKKYVDDNVGIDAAGVSRSPWASNSNKEVYLKGSLTEDGNVGIGLTSPKAKLDVKGTASFGDTKKSTFTTEGNLTMGAGSTITLSGGKITGLSIPAGLDEAANKQYVDDRVVGASPWEKDEINTISFKEDGDRVGIGTGTVSALVKLDVEGSAQFGKTVKSTFTDTGDLTMGAGSTITLSGGKITGLSIPAGLDEAANKQYVDDRVVGASPWEKDEINTISFKEDGDRVGIGTGTVSALVKLDVEGAAQFGKTVKRTFTDTGDLTMGVGSTITLSGGKITGVGSLSVNGPLSTRVRELESVGDDTIADNDSVLIAKNTELVTVNLPGLGGENIGRVITILKLGESISLNPANEGEKINSSDSKIINDANVSLCLIGISNTDWVLTQSPIP